MAAVTQAKRDVHFVAEKGYYIPEGSEATSMNDMIAHLDKHRPTYTCLYFNASWNPMCAKIEKDYEAFVSQTNNWHHVRVDCDAHPKIKRYFDARVEPQFLVLLNGGELMRMVGYNFEKFSSQLEDVQKKHLDNAFGFYGDTGKTWERFYDSYDKFSRYGEERDAFKAEIEYRGDTHRGPGTDKV